MNATLPRSRDEAQAQKKARILQEAERQFFERGFTATTLDDVAAGIGVTKPFLYTHFRGKADLLAALCQPAVAAWHDAVAREANATADARVRLHRMAERLGQVVLTWRASLAICAREAKHLEPAVATEIARLRATSEMLIERILQEGNASGDFLVPHTRLAAIAIGGAVLSVELWERDDTHLARDELCARIADLVLKMVAA